MIPINKMWERVEIARQDSDTALFLSLMYFGEMLVKLTGAGLVSAIEDDRERHRYRQAHLLVRADGIGDWGKAIEEILTGTTSQFLNIEIRKEQAELTSKSSSNSWKHDSLKHLHTCIRIVNPDFDNISSSIKLLQWFEFFSVLRNKTRAHGATSLVSMSKLCTPLEASIRLFSENFCLFKRPWAYLHRNLSGKYRVNKFTDVVSDFDNLKTSQSTNINLQDGVYLLLNEPKVVRLMYSDSDSQDFSFPNGGFNKSIFEIISYITEITKKVDAADFLQPVTSLPISETQGIGILDVQGKGFGNLPPLQKGYIKRIELEEEMYNALINDRHPVITLHGCGGIGKTWLTLQTLFHIAEEERFTAIIWFSARDIDLLSEGAKPVKPHVLTLKDIAEEFFRLTQTAQSNMAGAKKEKTVDFFAEQLTSSSFGATLFVFDNFETVRAPIELYQWIDTYVRLPNKVLITSRIREFKGDYPIEVLGMNEEESEELIDLTSENLQISHLISKDYKRELSQEASGHPYVMKILLGEVAKSKKAIKIGRIVATLDNILDSLFERTFTNLTPAAKKVFLTLSSWRSTIPLLALEAVLIIHSSEKINVADAAEELSRSSFIEITKSSNDGELFLTVPLVAEVFGKRKLQTTPMRSSIDADRELLLEFGVTHQSEIDKGFSPQIERFFRNIAKKINGNTRRLDNFLPLVEFLGQKYALTWFFLGRLWEELLDFEKAKEYYYRYIEAENTQTILKEEAWERVSILCRKSDDIIGEIHAHAEMCQLPSIDFRKVSDSVNRVNALFKNQATDFESEEKRAVSQRLAEVMEKRISEGDATDCSRLAWLFLRLGEDLKARRIVERGLSQEPQNSYCNQLAARW